MDFHWLDFAGVPETRCRIVGANHGAAAATSAIIKKNKGILRVNNFAALSQWQAFSSGLVQVRLAQEEAALVMHYDFGGAGGFVVARRMLPLQLPERFRVRLRVRGEGLPNRLEFKLVDPTGDNVWWYRRSAVVWSGEWEEWLIESRDFEFAWGPAGGGQPSAIAAVELAMVAEAGGAGRLWLADLQVEDLSAHETCVVTASGSQAGFTTDLAQGAWRSDCLPAWLQIDLQEPRAFAALRVEWESQAIALAFEVAVSNDGVQWQMLLTAAAGGRCSDIYLGQQIARFVRLQLLCSTHIDYVGITSLEVIPVERARSLVEFLHDVAQRSPCGVFPKYLRRRQSYWTVFGLPSCPAQGLINEEGMVEVQRAGFSLEPFLLYGGRWLTWADARHTQSLKEGYLPLPSVSADYGPISLQVRATAVQLHNVWCAWLCYTVTNTSEDALACDLVLAVRPFQVVPPWQAYREFGGVHPIRQMAWQNERLCVDQNCWVIPQASARGNVRAWLQPSLLEGDIASAQAHVRDNLGLAQGELIWPATLAVGASRQYCVAVPFNVITAEEAVGISQVVAGARSDGVFASATQLWREVLDRQSLRVPLALHEAAAVSKSSVAHILLNRDGAAIQPGPRRYARSWIRDGATMCAALLRTGNAEPVRDFLQWYAPFVRADGFVPCCVDREGVDWLVEHDSHGQWMHVVAEYLLFSGDRSLVEALLPSVIRAGQFIMALRASRYTADYDAPALVARRGLIPESVSHEGYLAQPVHSYWDSFWAMRGLADAAALCRVLQNDTWADTFAREEKALRADVAASIARVIAERGIPHIPGSVEWADSDPTASACAVGQLGERECYPAEALRYTFDGFMQHWHTRMADIATRTKYSAYDIRVINALVKLGRREDAWDIARFYLQDRRPCAWNQWPEITWPDPQSPGHLGDLPHSWIGAEYVLAFRCLFVDEYHESLVIGQGLLSDWLSAPGIAICAWPTAWGVLSYEVVANDAQTITLVMSGDVAPPGGLDIQLPLKADILQLDVDDTNNLLAQSARRVRVQRSPARLVFQLQKE